VAVQVAAWPTHTPFSHRRCAHPEKGRHIVGWWVRVGTDGTKSPCVYKQMVLLRVVTILAETG